MAPVGVGPGVAKPTPGDELSVGEALTKKRQDLAEFMGCSIEVVDDLEALTAGEKVKVKICGTHADGSELEAVGVLSESDLEAARQDAVSARTTATKFSDPPRNPDCRDGLNFCVSRQQSQENAGGRRTRSSGAGPEFEGLEGGSRAGVGRESKSAASA